MHRLKHHFSQSIEMQGKTSFMIKNKHIKPTSAAYLTSHKARKQIAACTQPWTHINLSTRGGDRKCLFVRSQ
jgi:hypothetical protein